MKSCVEQLDLQDGGAQVFSSALITTQVIKAAAVAVLVHSCLPAVGEEKETRKHHLNANCSVMSGDSSTVILQSHICIDCCSESS